MPQESMRDEDLLSLKYILERRLVYLQEMSYTLEQSLQEMSTLKLQENADIISTQSQLRFDDSMLTRNQSEIGEIESSLLKFEQGSYGICEMCEEEIGIERLQAKPHARFCINCREIFEKKEKEKERT
ncbi:TraR/DksA C4-type zinc finger protein [Helicobacter didelphidarum]|nr:TraR/DksA C4-type zinc finger protein [Helicobacter didelphidarum]